MQITQQPWQRCLQSLAPFLLLLATITAQAQTLDDYLNRVGRALRALDTLQQIDENETAEDYRTRLSNTASQVRSVLPETESVEWIGSQVKVDNRWLHWELSALERASEKDQRGVLKRISERLQALEESLRRSKQAASRSLTKEQAAAKLNEVLQRPEYARQKNEGSALARLQKQILEWLAKLMPKRREISPGSANFISFIAQVLVVLLALAVIIYVLRMFLPRLFRGRRKVKKGKREARVVLGETLAPDQSAIDLLGEAQALAQKGQLREAIRKAYIALLVELGERKVISLAQHKTNRDYLRSLRSSEPLHGNVRTLTESFERHWYGFAKATDADWNSFLAGYHRTLAR